MAITASSDVNGDGLPDLIIGADQTLSRSADKALAVFGGPPWPILAGGPPAATSTA